MFNVGDRVRCIREDNGFLKKDVVYTVSKAGASCSGEQMVALQEIAPNSLSHYAWRFELAVEMDAKADNVQHPAHYGGKDDPYEAIKVIEAWMLGFNTGNTVKYIARAGKKDPAKLLEDLKKARFYLDREIMNIEKQRLTAGSS